MSGSRVTQRMATKPKTAQPQPIDTETQRHATQEPLPRAAGVSSPIDDYLAALHERYAGLDDGQVATYIPELAKADPSWFGICVATTDGHVYEVGDTRPAVHDPVDLEAVRLRPGARGPRRGGGARARSASSRRGDAFNSISLRAGHRAAAQPDDQRRRHRRPTSLRRRGDQRRSELQRLLSGAVDLRRPSARASTRRSTSRRRATGHRNRAIGHMLRNFDILDRGSEPARSTSTSSSARSQVTCRDLALMAATLANGGVNPRTGERAIARRARRARAERDDDLRHVRLRRRVGLRRRHAGQERRRRRHPRRAARAARHRRLLAAARRARQQRPRHQGLPGPVARSRSALRCSVPRPARDADARQLQPGDGCARSAAAASGSGGCSTSAGAAPRSSSCRATWCSPRPRSPFARSPTPARTSPWPSSTSGASPHVDTPSAKLLLGPVLPPARRRQAGAAVGALAAQGAGADADRSADRRRGARGDRGPSAISIMPWSTAEARLIAADGCGRRPPSACRSASTILLRGLSGAASAAVQERLRFVSFRRGEMLVRQGDVSGDIYLLTKGEVSVVLELPGGEAKRLSTLSAGMTLRRADGDHRGACAPPTSAPTPPSSVTCSRSRPGTRSPRSVRPRASGCSRTCSAASPPSPPR